MNPETLVQRQLDAYNARDLVAFLACFGDDVRIYRPPATEPALAGKEAYGQFYATQRFNHDGLRADLLNRIVIGNTVIDHERIHGVRGEPFEVAAAYQVIDGQIRRVWMFSGG